MRAVEFETNLTGQRAIAIPDDAAGLLPSAGKAKVIVLFDGDGDDDHWRQGAYEQFMKEDAAEDAIYDGYTENR